VEKNRNQIKGNTQKTDRNAREWSRKKSTQNAGGGKFSVVALAQRTQM